MSDIPEGRPRATPRPGRGGGTRPGPGPRGGDPREETGLATDDAFPAPWGRGRRRNADQLSPGAVVPTAVRPSSRRTGARPAAPVDTPVGRRVPALLLVLALLCVLAAAGGGVLLWQRLHPSHVDPSILAAARSGIEAVYAYDYEDSEGSVQGKLDALTGDLRDQYERDLTQGAIIATYEQVSATTRYEVLDVGLQQVNEAQDTATLVVFGQYVVESVNSGTQEAPQGSECQVTPEGAQSCVQTVQVRLVDVDGDWKISELTLLTTS